MTNTINHNNSKQESYNFTHQDKRDLVNILLASRQALSFSSQEYLFLKSKMKDLLKKFERLDITHQQSIIQAIYWDMKMMTSGC